MKLFILFILITLDLSAQQDLPKIEIQANKTLALVQYVNTIASARQSILKEHFKKSSFNNEKNKQLLKTFNELPLRESIKAFGYPKNRKKWNDTMEAFTIIASNSSTLNELKKNSAGLFPLRIHQKLFEILKQFEAIYDTLFWNKNSFLIDKKVLELKAYAKKHDLNRLYKKMSIFYNSTWDSDLPLVISVVPYPEKTGFTATPKGNIIVSGLPLDMNYFEVYFGVMLHEIAHILYDEQEKSFQFNFDNWFVTSNSTYKTHAYNWINETLATAVGNGWVYEKLKGEVDQVDWYNNYHINTFSKALYNLTKTYLENEKRIDKTFIDKAIHIYEEKLADRTYDFENLLTYTDMMINRDDDTGVFSNEVMNAYFSKFRTRSYELHTPFVCGEDLEDFKKTIKTQVIGIVHNNHQTLKNIRNRFPFLKNYKVASNKNFFIAHRKENGQVLILVNAINDNEFTKVFEKLSVEKEVKHGKIIYF